MYEIAWAYDVSSELGGYLRDGWEPFAVTVAGFREMGNMESVVIWLRRKVIKKKITL